VALRVAFALACGDVWLFQQVRECREPWLAMLHVEQPILVLSQWIVVAWGCWVLVLRTFLRLRSLLLRKFFGVGRLLVSAYVSAYPRRRPPS